MILLLGAVVLALIAYLVMPGWVLPVGFVVVFALAVWAMVRWSRTSPQPRRVAPTVALPAVGQSYVPEMPAPTVTVLRVDTTPREIGA